MQTELKEVQKIFPEAKFTPRFGQIVISARWSINKDFLNGFYILNFCSYRVARTKDFSKILAVLKAIKEC